MKDVIIIATVVFVFLTPWTIRQSCIYNRVVIFSPYYDEKALSFIGVNNAIGEDAKSHTFDEQREDYLSGVEIYFHRFYEYWRFARLKSDMGIEKSATFRYPWSVAKNINNVVHLGLLLPFILIGIYLIIKRRRLPQLLILSFVVYHLAFHLVFFSLYRYRLPILPVLFLIGCYGAESVAKRVFKRL